MVDTTMDGLAWVRKDSDPSGVLVPLIWLDGGMDLYNEQFPGCWDRERAFFEYPQNVSGLVDYVSVDVAATGWWAVEWWATTALDAPRYMIAGTRRRMAANDLVDWSHGEGKFTGLMEEWQQRSVQAGHPIKIWIIEANAFARHLMQYEHFKRWKAKWGVDVIPHQTQRNKIDPKLGVEGLLPSLYHDGLKRIPYMRSDLDVLTFTNALRAELRTWPEGASTDTVIADWIGEFQLQIGNILRRQTTPRLVGIELPSYLLAQQEEVPA